jgi:hypothetical protein
VRRRDGLLEERTDDLGLELRSLPQRGERRPDELVCWQMTASE